MEKTRVNCFALFLLLVLLTGCSSTSGTSATVEELPEEAPSYVTELKVPTVEEVQEINEYVNGLISYGVGPQVEGRPITEEDYLDLGPAIAGYTATCLSRNCPGMGIIRQPYMESALCISGRILLSMP